MVDDRALRFRQQALPPASVRRQPRPTPQPVEPTPNSRLNEVARVALGMNPFTGTSQADRDASTGFIQRHGAMDALLAPASSLVEDFADAGYAPSTAAGRFGLGAAAFGADVLNPVGWAVGAPIDKTIGTGLRFANAYRGMSPQNRALYNSMVRGLYHGSRDTGANVARPFTAANRGQNSWSRNWFGGDMFGSTGSNIFDPKGMQVASGYTTSKGGTVTDASGNLLPGLDAAGYPITRGALFRLSEPVSDAAERNILDLTQGTLDQVDPALYQRLVNEFDDPNDILNFADDLAKMDLTRSGPSMGGLHESRYSPYVRPILEEFGYDTVKHLSGQLQGDIVTPVYAFLNSAGLRATPTLPSPGRAFDFVDANLSNIAQRGAAATGRAGAAIREKGASALDSLASVLSRQDPSVLPAPIRNFVEGRTGPVFRGENFPDARSFSSNPALVALLNRLGLSRVFPDVAELPGPVNRGAFPKSDDL
jgi:hypothetical protein